MSDTKITDKALLLPLNKLLQANDRLASAIQGTRKVWPYISQCWIDQLSEPTADLAKHRIVVELKDNKGG